MVHFFNPQINKCHHTVLCQYFGDQFMLPEACCKKCDPELLRSHIEAVEGDFDTPRKLIRERQAHCLPRSNLKKIPTELTKNAFQKILVWRHRMWGQQSLSLHPTVNITPEIILVETDLASLASHIHVAST